MGEFLFCPNPGMLTQSVSLIAFRSVACLRGGCGQMDNHAALGGAVLRSGDKQFLNKLVKWDKRNVASVVSLLWRTRLAGRAEAGLSEGELEIVLDALADAATYRDSGASSMGCWDCENKLDGRCAEHAKDPDRARSCTELASALTARKVRAELPAPADIDNYPEFSTVAL